jgi:Ca2+-binding RTX toxin-like protein
MAVQIFAGNSVGAGIRADLMTSDDAFVSMNATVGSEDDVAIEGTGNNHTVTVLGTVFGLWNAIMIGDAYTDFNQHLVVEEGGYVGNHVFNQYAVRVMGYGSDLDNRGTIHGLSHGAAIGGTNGQNVSVLKNSGLIEGSVVAASRVSGSTESLEVYNAGKLAGQTAFFSSDSSVAIDRVFNTGLMQGNVELGAGDDLFVGAGGRVVGFVDGGAGKDDLRGGNLADTLRGGANDDTLNGRLGRDILTGDAGKDTFVFNTKLIAANRDTIKDFKAADDTILLENAVFKGLTKTGMLAKNLFKIGTAATDADDRIVYNKAAGVLSYDPDGAGGAAQVQFAVLQNKAAISHLDFVVI